MRVLTSHTSFLVSQTKGPGCLLAQPTKPEDEEGVHIQVRGKGVL